MSNGARVISTLAAVIALPFVVSAQSVISTHSGVIHFFEGAVFVGDRPLESHLGKFPSLRPGDELRTAEGRAEILLTPGVFLRVGERSAIRMVANDLADTQIALESGSAIVDAAEPNADTSVTLLYKDWKVRFLQKGIYRINSDPPCLWVRTGRAEIISPADGQPVAVERGMNLPLAEVLVPERAADPSDDAFSDWAIGRRQSIIADNAITAQIGEDPAAAAPGVDGFTYFPMLGLSPTAIASPSPYGSYLPNQLGFNSIYLPGYTYRPLIFGITGSGFRTYSYPRWTGVSPGIGSSILVRPRIPSAPTIMVPRPSPIHTMPPHAGGGRIGVHR